MVKPFLLLACLALAACGPFPLARSIAPPPGRSASEVTFDVLSCKDRARAAATGPDKQARAFALGFTIVGAPLVYAAERSDQRMAFRACMETAGYRVVGVE